MKFPVSIPASRSTDGKWTMRREPVVPCFPTQHTRAFLAVPSFLLAEKAEVADIDADPDELADRLSAEYPGLPRTLHENYVLTMYKTVFDMPEGTVLRVSVSQDQAFLIDDRTSTTTTLWNAQPLT